jgi:polar amino acid transport system permease protein
MVPSTPPDRDFPLWLVIVSVTGAVLFWQISTSEIYGDIIETLSNGIVITIVVAIVAYVVACLLGLLLALGQLSQWYLIRQSARLYVEVMRGVPIIVLLLYVAFVLSPGLVWLWNAAFVPLGAEEMRGRDFPLIVRAVLALTLAYAAFLAEIFRAGLQSVDKGQIEAAKALGLNRWHRFRHVVFPQAFRTILPPLGNDFVAMVKDSSLVSVLGVGDITQLGKVMAAGNFRYLETYNVVALLYLTMTITLSLLLRQVEMRLRARSER